MSSTVLILTDSKEDEGDGGGGRSEGTACERGRAVIEVEMALVVVLGGLSVRDAGRLRGKAVETLTLRGCSVSTGATFGRLTGSLHLGHRTSLSCSSALLLMVFGQRKKSQRTVN